MTDLAEALNAQLPETQEAAPEPVIEEATPEPEAAPEPEQEPEQAQEPAPEPAKEPETPMVPLAALQEVRRELQEMKASLPQPEPPKVPDVFDDPQGFTGHVEKQMLAMQANFAAEKSEMMARVRHGDQVVDAALAAAQQANVVDQFKGKQDPWGELTNWHKSQLVQAEIGDDPAAYKERLRAEIMEEVKAELVAEQAKAVAASAAPSMAGVTGTGGGPKATWAGPTPLDKLL